MYDSKYDSKMHDITIPLMGFNGFHHAGNSEFRKDFEGFIGRESIVDKLRSWLEDNDPDNDIEDNEDRTKPYSRKYSGAYLITGFRGMGKSAFVHKTIREIKKAAQENKENSCYYVPISINVGNDLLTSKELLYIICKLLSSNFDEKTRWWHNKRSIWNLLITQIPLLFIGTISLIISFFTGKLTCNICDFLSNPNWFFVVGIVCLFMFSIMRYVYYYIWKRTDRTFFITAWQIKRAFKHLNERIDSEMTISSEHEVSPATKKLSDLGESNLGYIFKRRKENKYPIAQTSEIQDLLVSQLRLIKRLRYAKFRFIFIIDELDKISPEDDEEQIVPEYNSANVINGNSTYHSRQRAFVGLLANMKYFISSSEAKFIFITGYDMHEATLADISNREFNIHSIFNGYINVSSFYRRTGDSRGADSMTEKYFCHMLLRQKDGKRNDLHDYADFCRNEWLRTISKSLEEHEFELLLERRIIFLRHFLTYLFYMSNGSPKKLAIYLEKYVRSKSRIIEKKNITTDDGVFVDRGHPDITLGIYDFWDDCDWFLYFDARSIKKIEFINYLIYPMIKNLIAKSSIYTDKLLVSTSFMISNLYKFHKSGFSWRNLEYMPELLDINKTPELRDFIGGIMQFLNQTHIDEAAINLYKFKFPQRLSEEITYFSKTSEEISYLFNFSHDELLSIKRLYYQQLEHYTTSEKESPALASIHHMLGDIYMLEENYEQAIFEFNEALHAITRQEDDTHNNQEDPSNLLFRIRVYLKLGLAYEKRKTFDTAYITYDNLVTQILESAEVARTVNRQQTPALYRTLAYQNSSSVFFSNIRLTYLGILAKAAVLEKMDLGGISELDLIRLHLEFKPIIEKLESDIRPIIKTDFYTKLGIILFYKNGYFSSNDNEVFIQKIVSFRERLELERALSNKFYKCEEFLGQGKNGNKVNAPCMACQCFNASIKNCMEDLGECPEDYVDKSRSFFFIEYFYNSDCSQEIVKKGNVFLMTMANALLGMGNTLLGCIKDISNSNIELFFAALSEIFKDGIAKSKITKESVRLIEQLKINHYAKSILYYLAAAKAYELLIDYKSAYAIYVQILDAVWVYHKAKDVKTLEGLNDFSPRQVKDKTLSFCERVSERAIECTYLHYGSINCAEIDTQKHEMSRKAIDSINLQSLSNFPEIEVIIEKYYQLCLFAEEKNRRDKTLVVSLNSRQMGANKLIATLTQNVQNLYYKVLVNEEILSRIMPELYKSFEKCEHNIMNTLECVLNYYNGSTSSNLCDVVNELFGLFGMNMNFLKKTLSDVDKRTILLDHLLKDTIFCLNKIVELIAPLFSTTLYNNTFIGEIHEKAFNWNDVLVCVRDVFFYADCETRDKRQQVFNDMVKRHTDIDLKEDNQRIQSLFDECIDKIDKTVLLNCYNKENNSLVDSLYEQIYSDNNNYKNSSFLLGNAVDYYNRAIEMHSSGKTYKEMMPTLFFLEDDLHNDSIYMNLAVERFLLNHNFVQSKLNKLKNYPFAKKNKSTLLKLEKYFNQ